MELQLAFSRMVLCLSSASFKIEDFFFLREREEMGFFFLNLIKTWVVVESPDWYYSKKLESDFAHKISRTEDR